MANLFRKITCTIIQRHAQLTSTPFHTCRVLLRFPIGPNPTFRPAAPFHNFAAKQGIQDNISPLQLKKRAKRKPLDEEARLPGAFSCVAFSTAEEYDLEGLVRGLRAQELYAARPVENNAEAVHAVAKYRLEDEPREIFFFREGSVVLWNITELEASNLLAFLRAFESDSYSERLVQQESEVMAYSRRTEPEAGSCLTGEGSFALAAPNGGEASLDKYTFSNAMALSVKLGIWEASLEKYIDTIEFVTEDLKQGRKIKMTRQEALRKHGELFALRHLINLSSDLLDTPDFYWENEQLETLYNQVCNYFGISKRTKVMNEKINHCVELIELVLSHLNDKHHIRLEWMIIVLIMVEVGFETIHYVSR